eukprot:SAG11_NODE_20168_length_451_cov_1.005682_1_plen_37_part_10
MSDIAQSCPFCQLEDDASTENSGVRRKQRNMQTKRQP